MSSRLLGGGARVGGGRSDSRAGWAELFGDPAYANATKANILARSAAAIELPFPHLIKELRAGARVTDLSLDEVAEDGLETAVKFLWGDVRAHAVNRGELGAPQFAVFDAYVAALRKGAAVSEVVEALYEDGMSHAQVALFTGGCPPDMVDAVDDVYLDEIPPPPVPEAGMALLAAAFDEGDLPPPPPMESPLAPPAAPPGLDYLPPPPAAPPGMEMDYLPPPPPAPPGAGMGMDYLPPPPTAPPGVGMGYLPPPPAAPPGVGLGYDDEDDIPPPPPTSTEARADMGRSILTSAFA